MSEPKTINSDSLEHWQQQFTESLLDDLKIELAETFQAKSEESRSQRFAIYQNNVFYSLTTALGDLYPVVKKLVGEDFFTGTASYYLRVCPPQQAAMVHFGQDFPEFLTQFEHTQTMPFLAEVARLELARHRTYHATDKTPVSVEAFSQIAPEQLADATTELHPSLQLVQANSPIFSIWQTNQDDQEQEESINLDEPQHVLVVRAVYNVAMYAVDSGTYHFVKELQHGRAIEQAIGNTFEQVGEFDVSNAIQLLVQEQFITNINY